MNGTVSQLESRAASQRNFMKINEGKGKILPWKGIITSTSEGSGPSNWKAAWQKKGPGGQSVDHEPAMCLFSAESQLHFRLQGEDQCLPVEGGDASPLFSTSGLHLECWVQVWVAKCQRDMDMLEVVQWRAIQK